MGKKRKEDECMHAAVRAKSTEMGEMRNLMQRRHGSSTSSDVGKRHGM